MEVITHDLIIIITPKKLTSSVITMHESRLRKFAYKKKIITGTTGTTIMINENHANLTSNTITIPYINHS